MDNELIAAYQDAEYVVVSDVEFVMSVDQYCSTLKLLMVDNNSRQAAFITAFNPFSKMLDGNQNQRRHQRLIRDITELGLTFIEGIGRDKSGEWPGETSLLILGISLLEAQRLGRRYGQNAVIFIAEDAVPRLVLLNFALPIITHIPHSSTKIPVEDCDNFLRPMPELFQEINKLNDHFTDELFQSDLNNVTALIFPVNRFLVDVERFEDDALEPMSSKGMGALYTHDSQGIRFRSEFNHEQRESLLNKYYRPHHNQLNTLANKAINSFDRCLIIDAHSFPNIPLPCDISQKMPRPDICLGTDRFHTPQWVTDLVKVQFEKSGYDVGINFPYEGTMVPMSLYNKDRRLISLMIEINRRIYLTDDYQIISNKFDALRECINNIYRLLETEFKMRQLVHIEK
jgi:N-formylglutamate amidohydrolase